MVKKEKKKVAIIGAGIAGLLAGAYAAQKGYDVKVFEQWYQIGGVMAPYEDENGYKWDLGQLLIEGLGPDEPFGMILREIGVADKVGVKRDDREYFFPDFKLEKPKEYQGVKWRLEKLNELFPEDAKGLEEYWRYYKKFMKIMTFVHSLEFSKGLKAFFTKIRLYFNLTPFASKQNWNASQLMESFFKSEKLRMVFISILADFFVRPSQFMGLGVFALNPEPSFDKRIPAKLSWNIKQLYYYSILGGCSNITSAIGERIQELGGEIHLNTPVTKINVEHGRVKGLTTKDGLIYEADIVIGSGGAREIFFKLFEEGVLPEDFKKKIEDVPLMDSIFMVHLGLDPAYKINTYLNGVCTYCYGTYDLESGIDKALSGNYHEGKDGFVIHIPSLHSPDMAPQGHTAMTIYTVAPDTLTEGKWQDKRDYYGDKLLEYAEKYLPDLRNYIIVKAIITPDDWKKRTYLDHHAFGGIAPIMGKKGAPHETPIEDFWFIGHQSESGGGVQAVAIDVRRVMKKILK
ncbi:MAG: NAD(P)/FAD-dependent oxidoreductase [Candidatus Lokiarchaeota archaeon]|nr:NAD(P)/FAD-dependent oxidoreductase [Candidatus Lokiarchaeota archaeon]